MEAGERNRGEFGREGQRQGERGGGRERLQEKKTRARSFRMSTVQCTVTRNL